MIPRHPRSLGRGLSHANAANGNVIGASDTGSGMTVGLDPNNGIVALNITFVTNRRRPSFAASRPD